MPVLFPGGKPHDIALADFLNLAAFVLYAPASECHDQGLSCRVGMPGSECTRLECHLGTTCPSWGIGCKQGIYPDGTSKPVNQ